MTSLVLIHVIDLMIYNSQEKQLQWTSFLCLSHLLIYCFTAYYLHEQWCTSQWGSDLGTACVTSSDTDMVAMDTDAITMETAVKPETAVGMFCEHFNTGAYY